MDDAPDGAPARPVDNAHALPTARAFVHMPTAFDHDVTKGPKTNSPRFSLRHRVTVVSGHSMRHDRGGKS